MKAVGLIVVTRYLRDIGCFKTRKGYAASSVVVEPEPTAPPVLPKAEARIQPWRSGIRLSGFKCWAQELSLPCDCTPFT